MDSFLDGFGSVTLSLDDLIGIQLTIMAIGMFVGGLSFLCVYDEKINGRLQSILPISKIKRIKKKIKKKKQNTQLSKRHQMETKKREHKGLMASSTDTDYMTVQQHDEDSASDDDNDECIFKPASDNKV